MVRGNPLCSVLIPVYNGEAFLYEQLDSIINSFSYSQTTYEILIGDDGSTDASVAVINEFISDNPTVTVNFFYTGFANLNKNLNFLFSMSKGDYIFLSDQDDIWQESKVVYQLKALKMSDINAHDVNLFGNGAHGVLKCHLGFIRNLIKNTFVGSTLAGSRDAFELLFPIPLFVPHDQYIAFCSGTRSLKLNKLDFSLSSHRLHSSNVSATGAKSTRPLFEKIYDRFKIIFYCFYSRFSS